MAEPEARDGGDLLTMAEAIEVLKTTRATFNRWLKAGRISGMKVGRQWRFTREEIDRFLRGEAPQVESTTGLTELAGRLADRYREATGREVERPGDVRELVQQMIDLAVEMRASDVHIDPRAHADPEVDREGDRAEALVRFRIDGRLHPTVTFDLRLLPAIVQQMKTMAGCDVRERGRPQDGRILFRLEGDDRPRRSFELRVCFLPASLGECVTVRILDTASISFSLERLGLEGADLRRLRDALASPFGLVIVTGPTGSGKTTTHYSCLSEVVRPERKVMSVEDPVEYHIPGVVQVPVRAELGMTFESAFRHVLRSDPDVILVGEIRDRETLVICCQAAMTGHLVQSTLHARTAIDALRRVVDLGIAPFMIAESGRLIVAQRIVRVLCTECSEPTEPSKELLEKVESAARAGGLDWDSLPREFREPVGCPKCTGGFRGRVGIYETLELTPDICNALRRGAEWDEIERIALGQGMTTMAADGIRKAAEGRTTIEEVLRVTTWNRPLSS